MFSRPYSATAAGAENVQLFTGSGVLTGLSLSDSGGAVTLSLYDGTDNTGTLIARTTSTTNPANVAYPNVNFDSGLYAVLSGASTVIAYVG